LTVRPETEEPLRLPDAAWPLVDPAAWAVTFDAVTSPLKSENELTELEAVERAFAPTSVEADAEMEPVVTIEPSLGYANPEVNPTAFGGADTAVELAPGTTLTP
jgi:hypothetical protein